MDNLDYYIKLLSEAHCIMVDVPKYERLMKLIEGIPTECLYEEPGEYYGRETNPHVTVLYGVEPIAEQKAKRILSQIPNKIVAELGKISKFETNDKYDVLKIEVHSPHLHKIHEMLKRTCENDYQWPQYSPHITLAYVKKGTCNEYVGNTSFVGTKLMFEAFLYNNGNREENHHVPMKEYNVGTSGGYGGGAMAGGAVAPMNWAGTQSSPQTSRRLKDYPASRRYTYMQGNTVIGSSLYDTITDDDLTYPPFSRDEMFAGFRNEMSKLEYPDKDVARTIIIKNLRSNPKFYSDLDKYLKSDKLEENTMNFDKNELTMGTSIEGEHTNDDRLAMKIAMDHLREDPRYYSKLNAAGLGHEVNGGEGKNVANVVLIAPQAGISSSSGNMCGDKAQQPLASSGLGKSGQPKPLVATNLEAPETKLVNDKNTVGYNKTPPLNPNSDPVNHFCTKIAGAMIGDDLV